MKRVEIEIKIPSGRIVDTQVLENGNCRLVIESDETFTDNIVEIVEFKEKAKKDIKSKSEVFVLIEASKLSLQDSFMKYIPCTDNEERLKELLISVIRKGINDFYRPKFDPSFDKNGKICFKSGNEPAVGRSYVWWKKKAKKVYPGINSRLGTRFEYVAFLGVLIKRLVSNGWSVSKAWDSICNDSTELGHYWNSIDAKHQFEPTGSREVFGFFDLANTMKILADDENDGFWLAGGYYFKNGKFSTLCNLFQCYESYDVDDDNSTGWIVIPTTLVT